MKIWKIKGGNKNRIYLKVSLRGFLTILVIKLSETLLLSSGSSICGQKKIQKKYKLLLKYNYKLF